MGKPNAAILYEPDGYETSGRQIMGRHAAGEGFLKAFVGHADVEKLYCLTTTEAKARRFAKTSHAWGSKREVTWIPNTRLAALQEPGCLYVPAPTLSQHAWSRRWHGNRAYSLCGVTHTTASAGVMDEVGQWPVAPLQPWDAIICTSRAVRDSLDILLQDQERYLCERLGATRSPRPQLPIIPLGVDCDALAHNPKARADWRAKLEIGDDHLAVLFLGRLSFHAKVHPLPAFLALQATAQQTGKKLHLIMAGWFANEGIENAFRNGAQSTCPDVKVHFLDGCDPTLRREIWSAGDMFVSLSDNIQETFGLSPLEAMAAGLPVVATDWNGYRDTVRNGVDGFLVPTWLPSGGIGRSLAARFSHGIDDYDMYLGHTCQFTSVDIEATREAFVRLTLNPELRRSMGEAGKARARQCYDWRRIVERYQSLWGELAELRMQSEESVPRAVSGIGQPTRPDPFHMFAGYPSRVLSIGDQVCWRGPRGWEALQSMKLETMVAYGRRVWPSDDLQKKLIDTIIHSKTSEVGQLVSQLGAGAETWVPQTLVWLHKLGFVTLHRPSASLNDCVQVRPETQSLPSANTRSIEAAQLP